METDFGFRISDFGFRISDFPSHPYMRVWVITGNDAVKVGMIPSGYTLSE